MNRDAKFARIAAPGLFFLFVLLPAAALADQPPEVPPPKPIHISAPALRTLPNGLKVMVIERHALPIITLHLLVESGAEDDPADLPGTAQLVASLLSQGTAQRSAQAIAQAVDHVGGVLDTGAEWDDSFVAVRVLTDHTDFGFDLLADMAMHPAFAPEEVERQRKQALSALDAAHDDPTYVADAVLDCLLFAGTPYGHPPDGTRSAVARITAEDIRDFYSRHYRPANAILAVVGDIRTEQAVELADKYFSVWAGSTSSLSAQSHAQDAYATNGTRQIVVIDKPDAVQTEMRVGYRAISRGSADYLPLTVANQILGGPSSNRLYHALRTEHGLTYSASSDLNAYRRLGSWESKASTRTAETGKSVRVMLDEMKRLREHRISDYELRTAQSYLTGHPALDMEPTSGLAREMLNLLVYDLPLDYWDSLPRRLNAISADEVLGATQRYLDPESGVIVLVGNLAAFAKDLKKVGEYRVIPIHSLEFSSPTLESGARRQETGVRSQAPGGK